MGRAHSFIAIYQNFLKVPWSCSFRSMCFPPPNPKILTKRNCLQASRRFMQYMQNIKQLRATVSNFHNIFPWKMCFITKRIRFLQIFQNSTTEKLRLQIKYELLICKCLVCAKLILLSSGYLPVAVLQCCL